MLLNIDPLLGPDLLAALRAMGHGDEIAIVDANYPAQSAGRPLIRTDAAAPRMLDAVLSVMPLDRYVPVAAWRMAPAGGDNPERPIFDEFRAIVTARAGADFAIEPLARQAFYDRVRTSFAVIATGEARLYGNIIVKKGVVRFAGEA